MIKQIKLAVDNPPDTSFYSDYYISTSAVSTVSGTGEISIYDPGDVDANAKKCK